MGREWVRRWVVGGVGWVLLVVGVVLFPLPGPGLLLIVAALALLARSHEWAERRVDRLRRRALLEAARGVRTHVRAWGSIAVAVVLAASGLLWLWAPPRPAWWVLPGWTWLPGGIWSGVGQVVSGLVSLGVVLYAYRRFHGRPEEVAKVVAEGVAEVESPSTGLVDSVKLRP